MLKSAFMKIKLDAAKKNIDGDIVKDMVEKDKWERKGER